tara:strand:- start:178 stop:435 length:258 start_codon:yes stop_codon:yes gene_type:complete
LKKNIIQINISLLKIGGTIRGCHFQLNPYEETKVVSCCNSSLLDVGIGFIKGSLTFLQYFAQILTSENNAWAFFIKDINHFEKNS